MNNDNNSVFRKVSLDRLASPEQLDQLLPVTDGRGWVVLAAIGTVLAAAVVWGVLGRIPQNVSGTGILVKSGGVLEVIPVSSGQVTDVAVSVGEMVKEGQVVARMAQPEVAARLQTAKATLADLRTRHEQLVAFGTKELALQSEQLAKQRAAVKQTIASAQKLSRWTSEKIGIQNRLVRRGLLLKQTLLETRQRKQAALERIGEGQSQLAQIEVKELELRNRQAEEVAASKVRIEEAERTEADIGRELQARTQIVTPYTGRILEILTEQGMMVAAGEAILRLDLSGRSVRDLEAVIYVPSFYGKQIQVGMPVLIAPSTVKQEEFGMMLAKVTSVSDFPSTGRGMQRVLKNEKLVSALSGSDAPYEIHADLVADPATVSQYRWSSSKGPPQRIQSGTLALANIAVAYRRPIQLVIPLFREYSGL
jgi:HlyD family secretion protein